MQRLRALTRLAILLYLLSEAYQALLQDAAIIWNEMTGELPEGWDRANIDQAFVGAAGGCVGVETRMAVGLGQSYWCPPCINPLARPISQLGAINEFDSVFSSVYHGLTVSLHRRMTHGLYFRMAYTFAHAYDDG